MQHHGGKNQKIKTSNKGCIIGTKKANKASHACSLRARGGVLICGALSVSPQPPLSAIPPPLPCKSLRWSSCSQLRSEWLEASLGTALLWTPMCFVNFYVVPQHSRILVVSFVSFAHKTWLSWLSNQPEPPTPPPPQPTQSPAKPAQSSS
uniref:Uncharacterized protein n=1 Tax=Chrysotila carterae TaxID=13221 RepID=A0A6S9UMA1_CHRCT